MRYLLTLLLFLCWNAGATVFTEFYCDTSNGSTNINAGSTTNSAPVYIALNGNWDGTSVYTPTDGSTPASTVSAGMWAAIFIDGSTNLVQSSAGGCVMLITNVAAGVNGAITFNRAAFMGTAPSSSATGRSIRVGGCWNGPYGTIGFPFGFAANTGTNGAQATVRVNLRNTAQYNITAAMTHGNAGPTRFQGMTTTPGDLGKATIDGGATGTSYILLTASGAGLVFADMVFANNGNSGSALALLHTSGSGIQVNRCVFHDAYRSAMYINGTGVMVVESEIYSCNKANVANIGSINIGGNATVLKRCVIHDNPGSNSDGVFSNAYCIYENCIFDSNGKNGLVIAGSTAGTSHRIINCDFYNNAASGIDETATGLNAVYVENSNFFKNGAYGINSSGSSFRSGSIMNCAFGSGTQVNTSGATASTLGGINEIGTITYTADQTPWVDPANGDFRLSSGAILVKASGRGAFTQTAASYTGTIAYPDIGAAQSASTNSPVGSAYTWAQ